MITRINYGQNVSISGLAGAVSLAGSDSGLWSVEGGNWQLSSGLIRHSNASLHLHEEISSVSYAGGLYELNSTKGNSYSCDITVVATPLDEIKISFTPPISIPKRKLQHTHATFVRGLLNPVSIQSIIFFPQLPREFLFLFSCLCCLIFNGWHLKIERHLIHNVATRTTWHQINPLMFSWRIRILWLRSLFFLSSMLWYLLVLTSNP